MFLVRARGSYCLRFADLRAVNNVGRSHTYPSNFVDTAEKDIDDILAINVTSTLKFTHLILPGMVKRYVPYGRSIVDHSC